MRHPFPRAAALVIVASFAVGCSVEPGDKPVEHVIQTGEPIAGGYNDTKDTNVVVIYDQNVGALCSGSLIAPNVVLTARHCVAPITNEVGGGVDCTVTGFAKAYPPSHFLVSTSANINNATSIYTTREVDVAPGSSKICGYDQSLLILSKNVPETEAKPLTPRVDTEIAPKDQYSAVGYGGTVQNGTGAGLRRRRDNLFVQCANPTCPAFEAAKQEWIGDTGICEGDSGGPAIDMQHRVIGVTSRGGPSCSSPIYGDVSAWGQWIKDTTVHAAQLGGYDPPPWATGWPTDPAYSFPVGDACNDPSQCASNICVDNYCSRVCDDAAPCQDGYFCDTGNTGLCLQNPTGDPGGTTGGDPNMDSGNGATEQSSGCTVSSGRTRSPLWMLGVAALALATLRRRRR